MCFLLPQGTVSNSLIKFSFLFFCRKWQRRQWRASGWKREQILCGSAWLFWEAQTGTFDLWCLLWKWWEKDICALGSPSNRRTIWSCDSEISCESRKGQRFTNVSSKRWERATVTSSPICFLQGTLAGSITFRITSTTCSSGQTPVTLASGFGSTSLLKMSNPIRCEFTFCQKHAENSFLSSSKFPNFNSHFPFRESFSTLSTSAKRSHCTERECPHWSNLQVDRNGEASSPLSITSISFAWQC